tara:strand:+ start:342 stop:632 length:291 start_codon:yes stop_codon:yes gene_type:complete
MENNLMIIRHKNEIHKLIWRIKLKYENEKGEYNIPKKSNEMLETLTNSLNVINFLYDILKERNKELSTEKIQNLKNYRQIADLKNNIESLKKQSQL